MSLFHNIQQDYTCIHFYFQRKHRPLSPKVGAFHEYTVESLHVHGRRSLPHLLKFHARDSCGIGTGVLFDQEMVVSYYVY